MVYKILLILLTFTVSISTVSASNITDSKTEILTSYNIEYTAERFLNVTAKIQWAGLSTVKIRDFAASDCAVGEYSPIKIISGGVGTDGEPRFTDIVPSTGAKHLVISYDIKLKYSDKNLTTDILDICPQADSLMVGDDFFLAKARALFTAVRYFNHKDERLNFDDQATEIIWQLPDGWDMGHSTRIRGEIKSFLPNGMDGGQFFIGGKLRHETNNTDGTRHSRTFSNQGFARHAPKIHHIIEEAHSYFSDKFWKPKSHANNSLIIIQLENDFSNTIFGAAGNGQQIVFLSANYDYSYNQWELDYAALHELLHIWIPIDIIENSFFPYRHDMPRWLSEGFTEFATFQYLADTHPQGARYFQIGVNEALEFAETHNIEDNPYHHGFLISLQRHYAQRDKTTRAIGIYDDVKRIKSAVNAQSEKPFDKASFENILFTTNPPKPLFFDKQKFPSKITIQGSEFILVREALPKYDIGMELDFEFDDGYAKVVAVKAGGPAQKAGIEAGDILKTRISGDTGDVLHKAVFRVLKSDGKTHIIAYWPHGKTMRPPRLFYKTIPIDNSNNT